MKTTKLILGIIGTIISAIVLLASIAVTALGDGVDGVIGLLVGVLMLIAGITDIATRKSRKETKICGILFLIAGVFGILLSKLNSGLGICSGASAVLGIANFIVLKMQSQEQDNTTEEHLEEQNHSSKKNEKSPKMLRTIIITIAVTAIVSVVVCGLVVSVKKADDTSEGQLQNDYNDSGYSNNSSTMTLKDVELEETGFCVRLNYIEALQSTSSDTMYIRYIGFVKNPNQSKSAVFPTLAVSIKNKDGAIIATGEATKGIILPGDCVPITGEISVDRAAIDDKSQIYYQVSCSKYVAYDFNSTGARTTDFTSTNISERVSGNTNIVTGEVTNNSKEDCSMSEIVLIMRNEGEIVYTNKTYMHDLAQGQTRAFEFKKYGDWPEHDEIQIVVNSAV